MNTLGEAAVDIHNLPLSSETGSYPQLECIKIDLLYALLGEQIYSTDIQTCRHTHTNRNTHTHTHTHASLPHASCSRCQRQKLCLLLSAKCC